MSLTSGRLSSAKARSITQVRSLSLLLLLLMFLLLLFLLLLLLLFLLLFFGAVCFVVDDDVDDYDNYNGVVTSLHCQGQEYHLGGVTFDVKMIIIIRIRQYLPIIIALYCLH